MILPFSCFPSGFNHKADTFGMITVTLSISWIIPFYFTMEAFRKVLDCDDGEEDGLIDIDTIKSMVSRFFSAAIPLFYIAMRSTSSFSSFTNAPDFDKASDDLAVAWSSFFAGIIAVLMILAVEVWKVSKITLDEVLAFRITFLEIMSFVIIGVVVFAALLLETGIFPLTLDFMPRFFILMANVPPLIFLCLFLMLISRDKNTYYKERCESEEENRDKEYEQEIFIPSEKKQPELDTAQIGNLSSVEEEILGNDNDYEIN
uniref:Uncharacterized protein n=1 Tax=Corethron hystrix TaxID=216773 RepID=A0A7S1BW16_9STRA|mmetsp:Transcript_42091/g.98622  ORF Transcript_42091/g.98622 Transcript_42091/m.98622 type:complete len:260 (+) Transcript_42091:921-1700(+)